jgi:hypothetical protein
MAAMHPAIMDIHQKQKKKNQLTTSLLSKLQTWPPRDKFKEVGFTGCRRRGGREKRHPGGMR